MLWLNVQFGNEIFGATDQRTGFSTARSGHNQRGRWRFNSRLLEFVVLLFGSIGTSTAGVSIDASVTITRATCKIHGFPEQSRQAIEHGCLRDIEDCGKLVGRDM